MSSGRCIRRASRPNNGSEFAAIRIHLSSLVGYALDGAAVGILDPVGSRTTPSALYSGSIPSMRLRIEFVSATSRLRPRRSPPTRSRLQTAAMIPKAANTPATESPMLMPTRTGGSVDVPGG